MLTRSTVAAIIRILAQATKSHAVDPTENLVTTSDFMAFVPSPTYSFFSYKQMSTNRYATPLVTPLSLSTFAPNFSQVSTLLPASVTYTTYSLDRAATFDDGPFGQSAYAALWMDFTYTHDLPFTTTVSPTPVASSELVYPPQFPARPQHEDKSLKFPCNFIWGAAASAWQIEGGLQFEGRGPGAIDQIGAIGTGLAASLNDSNIANMNYFLYKQDIARLAALGVPHYSFTISWTRVIPFGIAGSPVNIQALDHYEDVIKTCYEYGVTPIITLMHADSPVGIFDDLEAFPEHFLYYAKQVMTRFADRIPIWFTICEPNQAPLFLSSDYNVLTAEAKAHAGVYNWYKKELKGTGRISTKFANNLAVPLDPDNSSHVEAAIRYQEFSLGVMANPLFLGHQIPQVVLDTPSINITTLTQKELEYLNGTVDFLALDPYIAQFAYPPDEGYEACASDPSNPLWPSCVATGATQVNGWLEGVPSNSYSLIAPQYVREQFSYVWNTYKPSEIMLTEFGFPQIDDSHHELSVQQFDFDRSMYYHNFLTEVLHTIHTDNVNVIGALAWSWIDNNEFGDYGNQYGMQTVNRTDGLFTRRYKRSFFDYVDFFHTYIAARQNDAIS
ncbi:hypothetical protein TruAng_002360 [Truncatella angustata]|nr:hypothetical protein TruAng_002360 [Truncatella angustata]